MKSTLRLLLPFSLMVVCLPAAAQDFPKYEFSAGYGYSRMSGANWTGFRIDGVTNIRPNLGIAVEFSNPRSSRSEGAEGVSYDQKRRVYAIMAGPRVAARGPYQLTPYAHLLLGAAVSKSNLKETIAGATNTYDDSSTQFALGVGGGIDYKWKGPVSFRGQIDYMGFHVGGSDFYPAYWEKGIRLSVGITFRFGDLQ